MSSVAAQLINEELCLPDIALGKFSSVLRHEAVTEAITFSSGSSLDDKIFTCLYQFNEYEIGVMKPGKEVFEDKLRRFDGSRGNNFNDMTPSIKNNGLLLPRTLSFIEIFEVFEDLMHKEKVILEIFGAMLYRSAFMLDHKPIGDSVWRLKLPENSINQLKKFLPTVVELPIEVFLYMLDVLALNEDVKYNTLGYNVFTQGYGRRNNLLTYSHLIAVFLRKAKLFKFAGSLARVPAGVAPMPLKYATDYFDFLGGYGKIY